MNVSEQKDNKELRTVINLNISFNFVVLVPEAVGT